HARDSRVAGFGHDREDIRVLPRHFFADEARPRQIAVYTVRLIALGPQVDEHEVVFADRRIAGRSGRVVRIAAVRADGADGRMIRDQIVLGEMIEDALLHVGLANGLALADVAGDEVERRLERGL